MLNKIQKAQRMKEASAFLKRLEQKDLRQTEWAFLMDRTPRCINFYVHGGRRIPPEIWTKLADLELKPWEDLCRLITTAKTKLKSRRTKK